MELRDEYKTACGGTVVLSQAAKEHLLAHADVGEILGEVLGQISLPQEWLVTETDLGRVVGLSSCVPAPYVGLDDPATFASRINRPRPSRVLVGAEKVSTSKVAVIARPEESGVFTLVTAWIGPLAPMEPGDATPGPEREASLDFWSNNALVWDPASAGEPAEMTWRQVLDL